MEQEQKSNRKLRADSQKTIDNSIREIYCYWAFSLVAIGVLWYMIRGFANEYVFSH